MAWNLYRKGIKSFSDALRIAWTKAKAARAKKVTFIKKDGTKTTRNITPLVGYKKKGTNRKAPTEKQLATVKVIDTDKVKSGLDAFRCIISFSPCQVVGFTY